MRADVGERDLEGVLSAAYGEMRPGGRAKLASGGISYDEGESRGSPSSLTAASMLLAGDRCVVVCDGVAESVILSA
jgi:hypothetical protein